MQCNTCNREVSDEALFCKYCGAHLRKDADKLCPECGSSLKDDSMFCPKCGIKIPRTPVKINKKGRPGPRTSRVKIAVWIFIIVFTTSLGATLGYLTANKTKFFIFLNQQDYIRVLLDNDYDAEITEVDKDEQNPEKD